MSMTVFTLKDFQTIKDEGFDYQLPDGVMDKIRKIASQVGSPNYVKTPVFVRKPKTGVDGVVVDTASSSSTNHQGGSEWRRATGGGAAAAAASSSNNDFNGHHKKRSKAQHVSEMNTTDWDNIRHLLTETPKLPEIPKHLRSEKTEGIQRDIREIRGCLNKMTDKTYDDMYHSILTKMDALVENEAVNDEDLTKVCESIFETASGNQFYSHLYARMYHTLMLRYRSLERVFRENYGTFTSIFENIRTANPDVDYDLFCQVNVENERRRALAVFMANLMNAGVITVDDMNKIIECFFVKFNDFCKESENKHICDEIIETIGYVIKTGKTILGDDPDFMSEHGALNRLRIISKLPTKENAGITKKVMFKCLDILDNFK